MPERKLEAIDDRRATFRTGARVWLPHKLRFDLTDVGPLMRCPKGLDLRLGSTAAPFLSWDGGSVGAGVPTPAVKWILLSFPDDQPPIAIGFSGAASSLQLGGGPGAWILRTPEKTDLGWVRLALPFGNRGFATNTAATLGRATAVARENAPLWSAAPPELKEFTVAGNANGVTATWIFDRPGIVVPTAFDLAPAGGYPLSIRSPFRRLAMPLGESGERTQTSTVITEGAELSVRFPARELMLGRALGVGVAMPVPVPSGFADVGGIARHALDLLTAGRTPGAPDLDPAYYESAPSATEPLTGQKLLFEADGRGLDLAAAQALLARCRATADGVYAPPEPQLVSLVWRRDWRTMGFFGVEPGVARRAGALAALAGAFSPDPARRLEGALFEAGLAAGRTRANLLALDAGTARPVLAEPFDGLRNSVFARVGRGDPFWTLLASPVRVVGSPSFRSPDGVTVAWEADGEFVLGSNADLEAPLVREDGGYRFAGTGSARFAGITGLPPVVAVPAWDEPGR